MKYDMTTLYERSTGAPSAEIADLAQLYGRRVFAAAYRVLGHAAQAEDVQQDVFLRLLERAPPDVTSWSAWLCTQATRLAIDRLRSHERRRRLGAWFGARTIEQHAPAAQQQAEADEQLRRLRRGLTRLKPREAECFALRHAEGLSVSDIAAALSISTNLVSVSLHRATQRLRAHLDD